MKALALLPVLVAIGTFSASGADPPKATSGEELAKAYADSRGTLAVDPASQQVVPVAKAGGRKLAGTVAGGVGRRLILKTGDQAVAVLMRTPKFPVVGEQFVVAAKPSGTYVYLDATGQRSAIPDYIDLTPTLGEFASHLSPTKPGQMQQMPSSFKRRKWKAR